MTSYWRCKTVRRSLERQPRSAPQPARSEFRIRILPGAAGTCVDGLRRSFSPWRVAPPRRRSGAQTAAAKTMPYDHIHLNVPDPAAAANWYEKNFGGKRITEAPDRLMFGRTRLMFLRKADAQPSAGSAIDHIGFSFADLDAKMKEFEAGGRQDRHSRCAKCPASSSSASSRIRGARGSRWCRIRNCSACTISTCAGRTRRRCSPGCSEKFGGQRKQLKGRLDAMNYSAPGFSDMWILVQRGDSTPSEGHAIDHIGWRSTGPLDETIDELKAQGRHGDQRAASAAAAERADDQLLVRRRPGRRPDRDRRAAGTEAGRIE